MQKLQINRTFSVEKERDHALQRIIERLEAAGIFKPTDEQWGANYWRNLLKRHCEKYSRTYEDLETLIGEHQLPFSHGLLKEAATLPKKYPKWGWLRNKLKWYVTRTHNL